MVITQKTTVQHIGDVNELNSCNGDVNNVRYW